MSLPNIELSETVTGALLLATQATLQALELPGLNEGRFHVRKALWDTGLTDFPLCLIAPASLGVDWNAGTNEREDITHSISVAFVAAGNRTADQTNLGLLLHWEERARRRFLNQVDMSGLVLPGGATINRTNINPPSETFLSAAMRIGWDAQYLIIGYQVREPRT